MKDSNQLCICMHPRKLHESRVGCMKYDSKERIGCFCFKFRKKKEKEAGK